MAERRVRKVLIHEMLHSFQLDLDYPSSSDAKSEGHIESLTVLIKLMLKDKNFKNFDKNLKKQDKHFTKQMGKLLYYINDDTKINTHVQEYYFDKSYILERS